MSNDYTALSQADCSHRCYRCLDRQLWNRCGKPSNPVGTAFPLGKHFNVLQIPGSIGNNARVYLDVSGTGIF